MDIKYQNDLYMVEIESMNSASRVRDKYIQT